MRSFAPPLRWAFIALGCSAPTGEHSQGVAEVYRERLREPRVVRPLEAALATRGSGEVFLALDRSSIESSRTEAEVACRSGDFAELDRVLLAMESEAHAAHERAIRQCADPAGAPTCVVASPATSRSRA